MYSRVTQSPGKIGIGTLVDDVQLLGVMFTGLELQQFLCRGTVCYRRTEHYREGRMTTEQLGFAPISPLRLAHSSRQAVCARSLRMSGDPAPSNPSEHSSFDGNESASGSRPTFSSAARAAFAAAGLVAGVIACNGVMPNLRRPNFGTPAPAVAASKFSKKSVSEKLSQVPVFAVTNASGQPYLANMDGSGSQIGLIFFSHDDALNMLKDMQKNPGASDARVYIMGLDKAYEMVKSKPTPSGIRGPSGEELTMVFRFFPDSKQVKIAENFLRKSRIRQSVEGVPVFVAKGLSLRKGSESVVPLFLTKEDLDAAWAKLRDTNKDLPAHASIEVGNLLFIITQMEKGEHPELRNLGLFAPRASVEYVTKEQAGPTGQARMHHNPVTGATK